MNLLNVVNGGPARRRARRRRRRARRPARPRPRRSRPPPAAAGARASTTTTAIRSYSSVGSARRSASRITSQAQTTPSAIPLPPAAIRIPSPKRRVEPVGGEHPERAAAEHQEQRGDRADPALDRRQEDRDREPAGEQVADVVVDERRGEVAPPLVADRADDRAEVDHASGSRPPRSRAAAAEATSAAIVASGRSARSSVRPARSARRPRRSAALRRRRSRAILADPDLVAVPLELRRPLAQPGAAVGALGHVRAHLGAAALADDAQLGRRPSPQVLPTRSSGLGGQRRSRAARARRSSPLRVGDRELAVSAGAVGEQVLDRLELGAAAERVGVLGEQLDQLASHLGRRDLLAGAEVDQPPVGAVARGADLVVVDQLGRVLDQRLVVVVERAEAMREADDQRGERRPCARPGSAGRRSASRPCRGSGAGARPTTGTCSPRSPRPASSSRPGGRRSPRCRSGAGCPRGGRRGRSAPATTSARCARPPRTAS